MATLTYSVSETGNGHATLLSSTTEAAGTHTTSGTASNISGVTVTPSHVLQLRCDGNIRVAVNDTASATKGIYVPANETTIVKCGQAGSISVIDV